MRYAKLRCVFIVAVRSNVKVTFLSLFLGIVQKSEGTRVEDDRSRWWKTKSQTNSWSYYVPASRFARWRKSCRWTTLVQAGLGKGLLIKFWFYKQNVNKNKIFWKFYSFTDWKSSFSTDNLLYIWYDVYILVLYSKDPQEPTSDLGEMLVSLLYNENLHRLTVTVIEARRLKVHKIK